MPQLFVSQKVKCPRLNHKALMYGGVVFSLLFEKVGCSVTERCFYTLSGSRRLRKKLTRNQTRCTLCLSEG